MPFNLLVFANSQFPAVHVCVPFRLDKSTLILAEANILALASGMCMAEDAFTAQSLYCASIMIM